MIERERALVSGLLRSWVFLVFAGILGAFAGNYIASQMDDAYEAKAELFIKMGNEYTVPSALSSNDRLLIDVDLRVAINAEIQIVTSWPVVSAALESLPHPTHGTNVDSVSRLVSASNVANSPILVLSVVDSNSAWSVSFLETWIAAYLERRKELFQRTSAVGVLEVQKQQITEELAGLRAEIQALEVNSGTAAPDARTELDLMKLRDDALTDMLGNLHRQEIKLAILSSTADSVDVLSAPRLDPETKGMSKLEVIAFTALIFFMVAASLVLLRGILRQQSIADR